jgi:hypothetical protein
MNSGIQINTAKQNNDIQKNAFVGSVVTMVFVENGKAEC